MNEDEPLLVPAGGGFTILYRNRHLYSPRAPRENACRVVAQVLGSGQVRGGSLLFIPSVGLGYGLPELLQGLPADCHVLCVETDQRLMALAAGRRGEETLPRHPRLTVVRTCGAEGAVRVLHTLGAWRFRRVIPLVLCAGYELDRPAYDGMRQALQEEIRLFWQNRMTLIRMGRLWLRNLLENLAVLPDTAAIGVHAVAGPVPPEPLLVAGAGPSLEGSLERIRGLRRRLRLACVDTALPALREAGLKPDLVVVVEAQAVNARDFLGWGEPPAVLPGTPLLCDLSSHPSLVRRFRADVRFFTSRFAPLALFGRLERAGLLPCPIPPLGSVGVAAVHLALELTSGPVLLAGLDFSYPGGRTHARGAPAPRSAQAGCGRLLPAGQEAWTGLRGRPLRERAGKDGRPVLTDPILETYAGQLAHRLAAERRVFDLGGEGLPLAARPVGSRAELERLCPRELPEGPAWPPRPMGRREAVGRFLGEELERVERLAARIEALLGGGGAAEAVAAEGSGPAGGTPDGEGLRPLIEELDWLYADFPEADPHPPLERSFLARLAVSAADYRRRLARLAAAKRTESARRATPPWT